MRAPIAPVRPAVPTVVAALARRTGLAGTSLIVADANDGARRLSERAGWRERARGAIVKDGWSCASDDCVLMVRPL